MVFWVFISFIIFQRLTELLIARRNEQFLKQQGAIEFGAEHYPWMVGIHTAFIFSVMLEVSLLNRELSAFWLAILIGFLFTQVMRVWSILSLGSYWNTKIIVLPGAQVVKRGPYHFIRHPNYLVVTLELLFIPMMFNAWITAIVFSCLNYLILSIRIPTEEKALAQCTYYQHEFQKNRRFIPQLLNKYDNS
jgi:methyltransferase